tara:strand:- start:273 stop:629 length:357 start_codon:yes stop_codon:yes gene_type:complete
MSLIFFTLVSSVLIANEPIDLDEFVENYFLLSKSKMENSPIAWQDTREGYFRAYGVYKADQIIDSLDAQILSHYEAGIRHFKVMEQIRIEVYSGKNYDHLVKRSSKPRNNVNYFSSSE